jgi:hypothetical protein
MAETPVNPEFHCPILRVTLSKWIARSFNLCGFRGFLRKLTAKHPEFSPRKNSGCFAVNFLKKPRNPHKLKLLAIHFERVTLRMGQ